MNPCSICSEHVESSLAIRHSVCQHCSHADCLIQAYGQEKPDYKNCVKCLGIEVEIQSADSSSDWPQIGNGSFREPHTTDGIDYVLNPGTRRTSVFSGIGALFKKNDKDPFALLNARKPLRDIMVEHEIGLDHMLRDGVKISNFLSNGYSLKDLKQFEYVSKMGPARALKTLCIGLGMNANHLRLYPELLPFDEVQKTTQLTKEDIPTLLGLCFIDDSLLQCEGDFNWTARDCVNFGITMDDLVDYGLQYKHQYETLMSALTQKEAAAAAKKMGVTKQHLAQLIDLDAMFAEQEAQAQAEAQAQVQWEMHQQQQQQQQRKIAHEIRPLRKQPEFVQEVEEESGETIILKKPQGPKLYEQRMKARMIQHGVRK